MFIFYNYFSLDIHLILLYGNTLAPKYIEDIYSKIISLLAGAFAVPTVTTFNAPVRTCTIKNSYHNTVLKYMNSV